MLLKKKNQKKKKQNSTKSNVDLIVFFLISRYKDDDDDDDIIQPYFQLLISATDQNITNINLFIMDACKDYVFYLSLSIIINFSRKIIGNKKKT